MNGSAPTPCEIEQLLPKRQRYEEGSPAGSPSRLSPPSHHHRHTQPTNNQAKKHPLSSLQLPHSIIQEYKSKGDLLTPHLLDAVASALPKEHTKTDVLPVYATSPQLRYCLSRQPNQAFYPLRDPCYFLESELREIKHEQELWAVVLDQLPLHPQPRRAPPILMCHEVYSFASHSIIPTYSLDFGRVRMCRAAAGWMLLCLNSYAERVEEPFTDKDYTTMMCIAFDKYNVDEMRLELVPHAANSSSSPTSRLANASGTGPIMISIRRDVDWLLLDPTESSDVHTMQRRVRQGGRDGKKGLHHTAWTLEIDCDPADTMNVVRKCGSWKHQVRFSKRSKMSDRVTNRIVSHLAFSAVDILDWGPVTCIAVLDGTRTGGNYTTATPRLKLRRADLHTATELSSMLRDSGEDFFDLRSMRCLKSMYQCFVHMPHLTRIVVGALPFLTQLHYVFNDCPLLEELDLSGLENLADIQGVAQEGCNGLRSVILGHKPKLRRISGFLGGAMPRLEELDLGGCIALCAIRAPFLDRAVNIRCIQLPPAAVGDDQYRDCHNQGLPPPPQSLLYDQLDMKSSLVLSAALVNAAANAAASGQLPLSQSFLWTVLGPHELKVQNEFEHHDEAHGPHHVTVRDCEQYLQWCYVRHFLHPPTAVKTIKEWDDNDQSSKTTTRFQRASALFPPHVLTDALRHTAMNLLVHCYSPGNDEEAAECAGFTKYLVWLLTAVVQEATALFEGHTATTTTADFFSPHETLEWVLLKTIFHLMEHTMLDALPPSQNNGSSSLSASPIDEDPTVKLKRKKDAALRKKIDFLRDPSYHLCHPVLDKFMSQIVSGDGSLTSTASSSGDELAQFVHGHHVRFQELEAKAVEQRRHKEAITAATSVNTYAEAFDDLYKVPQVVVSGEYLTDIAPIFRRLHS